MNPEISPKLGAELLDDFYAECDEHLKDVREALVLLEASVDKAQPDDELLEKLFRNFHSFKGISAIVGLRTSEELAHAAEDYLRDLTRGRESLSAHGLELLMASTQKLEQIVIAFKEGKPTPGVDVLMASLRKLNSDPSRSTGNRAHRSTAPDPSLVSDQIDAARARGLVLWRCTFVPSRELDERGININEVRARLSKTGEILTTATSVREEGVIAFDFVVGMRETPTDITRWEGEGISVELLDQGTSELRSALAADGESSDTPHTPFIAPSQVVRVDLHRLDELMRITGEMVIHRSRFEEQLHSAARSTARLDVGSLQEVNTAFGRLVREMRKAVMRVRLVPVAEIFARMPFVVRDLGRDTKKQVRLKLEGQQTEIDKYLIERLKDPLLHMVRNAFSHAAESPEERISAGKPPEATITLGALAVSDSVVIKVADDGRGIDSEAVKRRADSLGIEVPKKLDNAGLLKILCSPGFSTRLDADRASGRGVGMAVAYNTVRELGGSIALETELGKGTQFTLRLPLTLAIAETFIVSSGGQTCAISQNFVTEVLQINRDQIRVVNHVEIVPYRGGVLPIVRLTKMFRLPASAIARPCLLVLSSERGSSGLLVDKIHGQREVVVRAIQDPLVQVPGIAGATELGDGKPVLILDGGVLTSGPVRPHENGKIEYGRMMGSRP